MTAYEQLLQDFHWENWLTQAGRIVLILLLFWILARVIKSSLRRLTERLAHRGRTEGELPSEAQKRADTLVRLLRQGILILLWTVAGLVILRELQIDIGPILASAGIAGIAAGFGAQALVRDLIAGFFMILENQVRVGDVAVVNGTGGVVEQMNFRTIVLRDVAGTVHVFPNGTVQTLSNMTNEWSGYVMDIGVAYKEDLDRVMQIMKDVGAKLREDPVFGPSMVEDLEVFGVDSFGDSSVVIKARLKTRPMKQWDVGREYRRRLKMAFDRAGVEIPFPHRSIYFGEASKPFMTQLVNVQEQKTKDND